ncbi:hypothetical protein GW920_00160, partial [Candidatus Falkowbacteria bacterium]|nr:hypothetical protein [Candidatus Falkowbacteria bacterium]
MDRSEQLLDLLISQKIINDDQVADIKEQLASGKDLEDYLLSQKILAEEKLVELKSSLFKLPYYNVVDEDVPEDILNFLPEEIARTYKLVA